MIIDGDPGHDDALALLLAAGDSRLRLLGVTTVAGNQTLARTTRNALRILALAGVTGVPVAVPAVIDPAVLRAVADLVTVELTGTYTRGATVVDLHHRTAASPAPRTRTSPCAWTWTPSGTC